MRIDASAAYSAYARAMQPTSPIDDGVQDGFAPAQRAGGDFGSVLSTAIGGAINAGHVAETQAARGLNGGGDMTQIVTAVSQAQLALQTTTVVRDRMIQAYQDVMRMSI